MKGGETGFYQQRAGAVLKGSSWENSLPPKTKGGDMIKWLQKFMEKHFTEQEIRDIIKRDLPNMYLARKPGPRVKKYSENVEDDSRDMLIEIRKARGDE